MPSYWFRNKATGEEFEQFMRIAELEEFLAQQPDLEQMPCCPAIGYTMMRGKPDDHFRDRLKEIKKSHPGANINTW